MENYQHIASTLTENPDQLIEIVAETDDVCSPCPHRRGLLCETQEKIAHLDRGHEAMLGIKAGDVFSWRTACSKIKTEVTLPKFHHACARCSWKASGMCERKITQHARVLT